MEKKEAMKILKDFYDKSALFSVRTALDTIIPELKESEDEKNRKEIIDFLQETIDNIGESPNIWTMNNAKKWIAWLEKQGEHANFRNKIQVGDQVTRNQDGVLVNLSQLKRVAKKDEKQGEHKPAIPKFRVGDKLVSTKNPSLTYEVLEVGHINKLGHSEYKVKIFTDGKAKEPCNIHYMECYKVDEWAKLIEPKPAWSEEDETTRNNIRHIIRQYDKISKKNNQPCWYVGDCLLWMQNIKGRVKPQPKQEWSEEDESRIDNLCHFLEEYGEQYYGYLTLQGTISWLKSLKPNKQWKPTEEQIKALEWQLANTSNANWQYKATKEIYKQLKQL